MKKKLLIYAFIVTLISMRPANAQDTKSAGVEKKHVNLKEIVLGEEPCYDAPADNILIAKDSEVMSEDASPLESSLENQQNRKPDENTGFFNIFNLKGGVQKTSPNAEAQVVTEETMVQQWLNGNYATGRWFGARPMLEDHGVSINSSFLYGPAYKTGGGASGEPGGKGYSLFNLSVTVDTEKAGLWKGGTFYALYQNKRGNGLSGRAMGDYQMFDGWDFREMNQISEVWYQQKLFKDKLRLKFGKQDANADFCFLNSGFDFMNLSFSINPTVLIPTYPDPAFGFVAAYSPKEWISIKNGIYSRYNVPFNITEIEVKPTIKKMPGRYMIGAWALSDSNGMNVATSVGPGGVVYNDFNRNYGCYAGFEQMVYKEKKDDNNDMQGLIVFGQFGMSPSNKNDMSKYLGGGLSYTGLIPKRDKDKIGIGVASGSYAARLGDITSQVGSETALEAFYRFQITPWFYMQPDVQFIMSPSGYYDNSIAFGIRSVVVF